MMEPIPEYIEFAGELVEVIPDGGAVRLFRVVIDVKKFAEHHDIDITSEVLDFHLVAQAAQEEVDAFNATGREILALPLSGSGIEPIVLDINHAQFTWMVH